MLVGAHTTYSRRVGNGEGDLEILTVMSGGGTKVRHGPRVSEEKLSLCTIL
jgi:hypothetical protein